jgi:protein-disulfide isomerase
MLGVALAAAAILVVVAILASGGKDHPAARPAVAQKAAERPRATVPGQREASAMLAGIPQQGISLGRADAPVRMVEFADLQCPICRNYALQTLPVLVQDYVRTGKVRMDLRMIPIIGDQSVPAERAAQAAARENRMWNFAHVFYFNQGAENSGYVTPAFLSAIYRGAGVDATKASAFATSSASTAPLRSAIDLANQFKVDGTPTFLVGRRDGGLAKLSASQSSLSGLRSALDGLLR